MNYSRIALRAIVTAGCLCVALHGQDSLETPAAVDTILSIPQPDSAVVQEPASTTDSVAITDAETKIPVASTPDTQNVVTPPDSVMLVEAHNENIMELETMVDVGYGTVKQENLTGSVTVVKTGDLTRNAAFSVRKSLQGKAAGVNIIRNSGLPGKALTVRIRGVGSINNNDPLYVVDGTPVHSIDYLNPNDIASLAILKDASVTAIYGARGANGAILVTTKNGTADSRVITYDMFVGRSQPWKDPSMCNAVEWTTLVNEARENANRETTDTSIHIKPIPERSNPSSIGEGTNWFREITRRDALIHQENVSVSQGNDRLKSFLSAGLFSQEGSIKESGLNKIMLRINTDSKLTGWLTLGNNFGMSRTDIDYVNEEDDINSVLINALAMDPVTPVRDRMGQLMGSPYNNVHNPVGRMEYFDYREKNTAFTGSFFSNMNIFNILTFKTILSLDMLFKDSSFTINSYNVAPDDRLSDAFVSRRPGIDNTWTLENTLSYEKLFLDRHSLKLLAGTTSQDRSWDSVLAENTITPGNDPEMRYLNATTGTSPRVRGMAGGNSLASFFGRMEYEYANRYLVTFTDRLDGSSRFGPDNRWSDFPSVAGAWKVSNESFMGSVTFIDDVKLRAGWGKTGNLEMADYLYLTPETDNQNYPFGNAVNSGTAPLNAGNSRIHGEEQTSINAGVDIAALGDRIDLTADYFVKNTLGMLVQPAIPSLTGFREPPMVNEGAVENRGVEVTLNCREKIGSLLADIGIYFSTYKNKVLSLGGNDAPINDAHLRSSGSITRTEVGHPIASFYALKTDGLFQTQAEVDNHTTNGIKLQPSAKPGDIRYRDDDRDSNLDKVFVGSPHPDFTAGMNINLAFKGFDFGLSFFSVYGNEIFNCVRWYTDNTSGAYGLDSRMLGRWTGPGSTNNVNTPRMNSNDYSNFALSDRYIEDGSYVRLNTMQLGYSFDTARLRRVFIKRCRIYVGAENLLTLTGYSGLEPEIGSSVNIFTNNPTLSLGVDRGTYPQARTCMMGLNLTL